MQGCVGKTLSGAGIEDGFRKGESSKREGFCKSRGTMKRAVVLCEKEYQQYQCAGRIGVGFRRNIFTKTAYKSVDSED